MQLARARRRAFDGAFVLRKLNLYLCTVYVGDSLLVAMC
jgi:hypothetical protein